MTRTEDKARRAMLDRLAFAAWLACMGADTPGRSIPNAEKIWRKSKPENRARWVAVVRAVFTRFAEFEVSP